MRTTGLTLAAVVATMAISGAALADDVLFGYISPIAANPSEQTSMAGQEAGAKALGWNYSPLDGNLSADKQIAHVDTLLTMGAKAIAIWSMDPNALAAALKRSSDQGVPVIGVISPGEGVTDVVWWAVNVCTPGGVHDQQVEWIAKRKPGAKVVIMGGPPAPSILQNVACFTAAAKAGGLEVVTQVDNLKDSTANAATLASDVLLQHPDTQVFWSYNDATALGASVAVIGAGGSTWSESNPDGVMIFGINGDSAAIDAVREGRMTGTWDPDVFAVGLAIISAAKHAIENPGAEPLNQTVVTTLFTAENIADYKPSAERGYTFDTIPLVK